MEVELVAGDTEHVAPALGHQDVAGQRTAETRYANLEGLPHRRRRPLAPQLVDEPVGRHRLVGAQEEQGEDCTFLRPGDLDGPAVVQDFERPEDPEVQPCARLPDSSIVTGS